MRKIDDGSVFKSREVIANEVLGFLQKREMEKAREAVMQFHGTDSDIAWRNFIENISASDLETAEEAIEEIKSPEEKFYVYTRILAQKDPDEARRQSYLDKAAAIAETMGDKKEEFLSKLEHLRKGELEY